MRTMGGARMELAVTGKATLAYEAKLVGIEEHIPVLFLHGWGCDHSIFSFFANGLKLPFIAVDFPGHGQSPEPPSAWAVADFADQIVMLLKMLSVKKVDVIAHSFGGRVAIMLAAKHPELLEHMVITGGAGLRKPSTPQQQQKQERYRKKQEVLGLLKSIPLFSRLADFLQKTLQEKYASPDYLALSDSMKETFKKIVNEDLSPLLSSVSIPTLLIWGTEDQETPLWMGEKMEKEMKDAALILFEGGSHFAFLEEPQRFLLILNSFLKGDKTC